MWWFLQKNTMTPVFLNNQQQKTKKLKDPAITSFPFYGKFVVFIDKFDAKSYSIVWIIIFENNWYVKICTNKKVLLRECKWHTVHVTHSSWSSAVEAGGGNTYPGRGGGTSRCRPGVPPERIWDQRLGYLRKDLALETEIPPLLGTDLWKHCLPHPSDAGGKNEDRQWNTKCNRSKIWQYCKIMAKHEYKPN